MPGGLDSTVTPGRTPRCQVRPASPEIAKPMFDAAPCGKRPSWYAATTVIPCGVVRLDCSLVLARRVRRQVHREPARDDLAVRRHLVGEVGADDVEAGPAVDAVDAAEGDLDEVVAGTGDDPVRALCPDDRVAPGRAVDRGGRGRRGEDEREDDQESAHRVVQRSDASTVSSREGARVRRDRRRQRVRWECRGVAADREGLSRRRARGGPAVRRRRLRAYELEPAPLPVHAPPGPARHPAADDAERPRRPLGCGRRRRLARVREHALRAARPVLRRRPVGGDRRLARGARAVLRACAADAGVVETPFETAAETVVREVAQRMGVAGTFHRTPVASTSATRTGSIRTSAAPARRGARACVAAAAWSAVSTTRRTRSTATTSGSPNAEARSCTRNARRRCCAVAAAAGKWRRPTPAPGCGRGGSCSVPSRSCSPRVCSAR